MNDDELRRLIAADIADHTCDAAIDGRLNAAIAADQRRRVARRFVVGVTLVAAALIVLSTGYWLAAAILPPLTAGGVGVLLWGPLIVLAILVIIALRSSLLALAESQ